MSLILSPHEAAAERSNGQHARKRLREAQEINRALREEVAAVKRGMIKLALERNALVAALIAERDGPLVFQMDELAAATEKAKLVRERSSLDPETGKAFWVLYLTSEEEAVKDQERAVKKLAGIPHDSTLPADEAATSEGTEPDPTPREPVPDESSAS